MAERKRIDSILWSVDEILYSHHPTVAEVVEVGRRLIVSAVVELAENTNIDVCTLIEAVTADLQEAVRELMEKTPSKTSTEG